MSSYKGERSCPLPLGMAVAIPHPLPRFGRICAYGARGISPSAEGDQRAPPFGNLPPLKRRAKLLVAASPPNTRYPFFCTKQQFTAFVTAVMTL
ncbi:MAG: hypothetical protein NC395_04930 [Prevotella sp.]|nr:hypothetical protein [Prevotella sp.]